MEYADWILAATSVVATVLSFGKMLRNKFERTDYQLNKIDKRFELFEGKMDTRFLSIEEKMEERFQRIHEKLMNMEDKMSQRFQTTEERFQEIQYVLSDIKERMAFLEASSIYSMPETPPKPNLRSEAAKLRWQKRKMKKGE